MNPSDNNLTPDIVEGAIERIREDDKAAAEAAKERALDDLQAELNALGIVRSREFLRRVFEAPATSLESAAILADGAMPPEPIPVKPNRHERRRAAKLHKIRR